MKTVSLRLSEPLYRVASELAIADGISVEQLVIAAATRYIAARNSSVILAAKAVRGNASAYRSVLARVPAKAPRSEDRLPAGSAPRRGRSTSPKLRGKTG